MLIKTIFTSFVHAYSPYLVYYPLSRHQHQRQNMYNYIVLDVKALVVISSLEKPLGSNYYDLSSNLK